MKGNFAASRLKLELNSILYSVKKEKGPKREFRKKKKNDS